MLAAELGNDAIVALLAQKNANLKLKDAEGKGEQKLFALDCAEYGFWRDSLSTCLCLFHVTVNLLLAFGLFEVIKLDCSNNTC